MLHFGSDETLAERRKKMGDLFEGICDPLADLALRIEKREKAKPFEIDHLAKIVMTKVRRAYFVGRALTILPV